MQRDKSKRVNVLAEEESYQESLRVGSELQRAHCRSELATRSLQVYSRCVQMEVARVSGRELAAPCDVQRGDRVVTSVRVLIVDANVKRGDVNSLWWRGARGHS